MVRVVRHTERRHRALGGALAEDPSRFYDELRKGGYSWVEDCLERLEGKEARQEYYVRLARKASR